MLIVEGLDHVALIVRDAAVSAAWYRQTLGLKQSDVETLNEETTVLRVGNTSLALFPCRVADPRPVPGPETLMTHHLAFRVDRANFERAQKWLRHLGIRFEKQEQASTWSLYFRDPDGHQIELTTHEVALSHHERAQREETNGENFDWQQTGDEPVPTRSVADDGPDGSDRLPERPCAE